MITSIAQLCREKGVKPEATIYGQSSRQMLDFQIVSGDFYRFVQKENGKYALRYKECVEIFDFQCCHGSFCPFGMSMPPFNISFRILQPECRILLKK